jgi:hypothetical protein
VVQWGLWFPPKTQADSCRLTHTTGSQAGALTVAGQWRTFTAFPSILAIVVISRAATTLQHIRHETDFHDINIYNRS